MGGIGSGRQRFGERATVEGCLQPEWAGKITWSCDGEPLSYIGMSAEVERIVLSYSQKNDRDDGQSGAEPIPFVWRPCRFGGSRHLFRRLGVVVGVSCKQPILKLNLGGRYVLCRNCYRLAYASQPEAHWDRALRRPDEARIRLGAPRGTETPLPESPKGMWHGTYERPTRGILDREEAVEERLLVLMARFNMLADRNLIRRRSRVHGTGPRFIPAGRRILHRRADIEELAEACSFMSMSEANGQDISESSPT